MARYSPKLLISILASILKKASKGKKVDTGSIHSEFLNLSEGILNSDISDNDRNKMLSLLDDIEERLNELSLSTSQLQSIRQMLLLDNDRDNPDLYFNG